ncbi:hypothetical protein SAMN02745674_00644 [Lysobacter spongiicola DSM 21749]|uniref:Uncharacterized protein n=1 Tax=Lysobacter spongiicola DSM 21749 TaxID=1122188 RepID=A0A1T4MXZ4_9GAMM|nr:hypothetical protein SAMN02745674_00644 [Lysobacter spongiicola DSM 21749]
MWIGKSTAAGCMLAGFLIAGCSGTSPRDPHGAPRPTSAWRYDVEFESTWGHARGIAASDFSPSWSSAAALDDDVLSKSVAAPDAKEFLQSPLAFSVEADLDGDGRSEDIFVGVFSTDTGTTGRFVAVTRDGELLQHFEHPGTPGFSALLEEGDELHWYKCMQCGEFETLRWSGGAYVLD